jgi:hypothetical protein
MEEAEEVGWILGWCACGVAGVILESEEFDAVASGENEAFTDSGLVEEGTGGVGQPGGGYSETLPNLDRRGVVIDAEKHEVAICDRGHEFGLGLAHGAVNL